MLHDWLKIFGPLFIQSEVKPESIAHLHTFSRSRRQLDVLSSRFDWFTVLSMSFAIGQSDCFVLALRYSVENRSIHDNG